MEFPGVEDSKIRSMWAVKDCGVKGAGQAKHSRPFYNLAASRHASGFVQVVDKLHANCARLSALPHPM